MKNEAEQSNPSTGSVCEPVAWAVFTPDGFTRVLAFSRKDARIERKSASEQIAPLYRQPQPALTDAEREAIHFMLRHAAQSADHDPFPDSADYIPHHKVIFAMMDRLK